MIRLFFYVVLVFLSLPSSAQMIVNIESKRMQSDTTGWRGSLGASFSFIKNVQQILNINANAHLQYKTQKDLYLVLAHYNLLKNKEQRLSNNMFFHLRYNRKVTGRLRWELFTQWQQNAVTHIDFRFLAGTGPRFKVHESATFRLYAATAAMYEHEREKTKPVIVHDDIRSSTYVSFTWQPTSIIELISTTFYQPLFRQPDDFRILNQITVNIRTGKHLLITTGWDYLYDAFPAGQTPKVNYVVSNGITYTF